MRAPILRRRAAERAGTIAVMVRRLAPVETQPGRSGNMRSGCDGSLDGLAENSHGILLSPSFAAAVPFSDNWRCARSIYSKEQD